MTPSLFDPPWSCTEAEYRALVLSHLPGSIERMRAQDTDPGRTPDERWSRIYSLCWLRQDSAGMDRALKHIEDPLRAEELAYRDVISTEEMDARAREG